MVAQMDAEKRSEQALLGERLPDATDKPDEVCSFCTNPGVQLTHIQLFF